MSVDEPPEELDKTRVKLCQLAEEIAKNFDITLDYSPQSIPLVEDILSQIHEDYLKTKSDDGLDGIAIEFGAYLVAVIEKHYGPVKWERDHPNWGSYAYPLYWRGTTLFPVAWCGKRIYDGEGDDIRSKWQECVEQELKESDRQ